MVEQTLVLIKPDGLVKSLTGNIITRLSETKLIIVGAKIVQVSKELAEKMRQNHPAFHPSMISAKRWHLPEDIPALGYVSGLFARDDLRPDIVYTLMKTLYDHFDEFKATHPVARYFSLDSNGCDPNFVSVPWHKGAVKYLKEMGRWTNEHEKLQKELVSKLAR